jgi:predicted O-methyltransferase YrrM
MNIKKRDTRFEKNFSKVIKEVQKKCDTVVINGVPDAYKEIWVPDNKIRAWAVPPRSGEMLKTLVLAHGAKTILELGTSFGYSTLWLAAAARYTGGKVHTIELTKPKIAAAKVYFKKARLDGQIHQIEGRIDRVLSTWKKKVDFVFMDADKMNYFDYFKQLEPFLEPGAVIVADNASNYADLMKKYLDYVKTNPRYHSFLLEVDFGLMIVVKGK